MRRALWPAGLALAFAALALLGARLRSRTNDKDEPKPAPSAVWSPSSPESRPPSPPPVTDEAKAKQGSALHDATLRELIVNARLASQRGDDATRDAMLSGLKKEPRRARELLRAEIARTSDPGDADHLNRLLSLLADSR